MQRGTIYDRIDDKKENVFITFFSRKGNYYGYYSMVSGPHVKGSATSSGEFKIC